VKGMSDSVNKVVDTNAHSVNIYLVGRQWAKPKWEKTE
jgi:hypothetical protein